ncbi:MAG: Gldg family protein [Pseudomonadota bacterium]
MMISRAGATLALLAVLLVAINGVSQSALRGARIDLTQGRLYTLSEGTKSVLSSLEGPVRLRLYFSAKAATGYPQLKDYARRVEDNLREYAALAGGKLQLEVIDPEPFTEAEDEAVAYGLRAAQSSGGEKVFFGLVGTNDVDGKELIPFFAQEREALLEYDLTQLVDRLAQARPRPKIALVTSLPMQFGPGGIIALQQGRRPQPYVIYEQLRQAFDVTLLQADFDRIDEETRLLVLAHPAELGPRQLYLVDQFVLKGGKALVFLDPYSEAAAGAQAAPGPMGMPQPGAPTASDLSPLLEAWGVKLEPGKVVGDLSLAQRVNMGGPDPRRQVVDYIPWLAVTAPYLAGDDIVTADLAQVNLASAGALTPLEGRATTVAPLMRSSDSAALIDAMSVQGEPDPDRLIRELAPTGEAYMLAARITGPAKSAYPDGPPKDTLDQKPAEEEGAEAPAPLPSHKAASDGPINVIVVADADMLEDRFWAQVQDFFGQRLVVPYDGVGNASFVLNAVDNLSGSDALVSLRSRAVAARPFTVIERLRREAEVQYLNREQMLEDELRATERRIAELEGENRDGETFLTPEQLAEIERFRAQAVETRRALRAVQRDLRQDIERLQGFVTWTNILAIPLILVLIAMVKGWRRRARGAA